MSLIDDVAAHLKTGRVLYTKARGTRFTAHIAGGALVIESDRSGRKVFTAEVVKAAAAATGAGSPPVDDAGVQVARSLMLAKALYRRSSKAGHGEAGWKASLLEALLAGVSAIANRAGLAQ
jgi:hypothetical protein